MAIDSDILDRLSGLVGRRDLTQGEMADWFGGAADGGPAGDGLFPLTDSTGYTRMVPSPAKQMATMASGLDAEGVAALPAAAPADLGVGAQLLLVAPDGTPKRGAREEAISPRGLPPQSALFGDEVVVTHSAARQAAGGTGTVGTRLGSISTLILGNSNPVLTHAARGDGRVAYDAVTHVGSDIVESPSSPFSGLDVGKLIWLSNASGNYGPFASTIVAYLDSQHVRIAHAAGVNMGPQQALWGTDNTANLQAWADDLAGSTYNSGKAGKLPDGMFLTKGIKYGTRCSIEGQGSGVTTLALIPGGSGRALLDSANNHVVRPLIRNMSLLGNMYLGTGGMAGLIFESTVGGAPDDNLPDVDPYPVFADLEFDRFGGNSFVHLNRGGGGIAERLLIRRGGYYGLYSGGYDMTYIYPIVAGCRLTGIYFSRYGSGGNNIRNFYSFFNGSDPYQQYQNGVVDPRTPGNIAWEDCANMFVGGPQQIGPGRLQESWGPNLVIACPSVFMTDTRLDDTGCVRPAHAQGSAQLLSIRPAIMLLGPTATDCVLNNLFVTTAVHHEQNFATQALFFASDNAGGHPDRNTIEMKVQASIGAYYGSGAGAYAPAQIGTENPAGYGSNKVLVDFERVI